MDEINEKEQQKKSQRQSDIKQLTETVKLLREVCEENPTAESVQAFAETKDRLQNLLAELERAGGCG